MPNRCSILTGRMPTAHGVIFNDRSLDWNSNTFVRQFKRADYSTTLIGKSHIQHGASRNSIVPFRGEGAFKTPHGEHWDKIENSSNTLMHTPEIDDLWLRGDRVAIDHGARVSDITFCGPWTEALPHDLLVDTIKRLQDMLIRAPGKSINLLILKIITPRPLLLREPSITSKENPATTSRG